VPPIAHQPPFAGAVNETRLAIPVRFRTLRGMTVLKVSHEQTAKMYMQLLNLLEEMALQASEQERDEDTDESGLIQSLAEEAEERGLDSESVERILKIVSFMRKKAGE
jgi:hypothetical protein